MKISLKWINEFVSIEEFFRKPEELAEKLTRAGFEVEEIINKAKDFNHVVIGLILEKDKHPNADKLSLCRVTTGEGVVHQIVCGAQNHKTGDRVVVALPGAVLPGNFQIKQSMIRNVESSGMLCSLKELGLPGDSQGIIILPEQAPIGKDFAEYMGLDDILFELKVTPNRADALSHFGLSRELSCLIGRELKIKTPHIALSENSTKKKIHLDVRVPELCPRYSGRYIEGVQVQPSPDWLKKRLELLGMNSINNIVDVTNYVMLEYGQPLHAFDADQLSGAKVIVDTSKAGEKFVTLDGSEKNLNGDELTIRDAERPVCLAGVLGGKNSGVSDKTKNIFLESAYFTPMSVRKTARTHGLETDSAYRFSRGVDPDGVMRASDRAVELILQVAGGQIYSDPYDFYPQPVKKNWISIQLQTFTDRLGYPADENRLLDFLKRLGCEVRTISAGNFEVLPANFRFDLEGEMDFVEEYARLVGYEHIPESLPAFRDTPSTHDKSFILNRKTAHCLMSEGYYQAFNFAFVSEKGQDQFLGLTSKLKNCGLATSDIPIRLRNPLNEELNVMRTSLSFGLAQNLLTNVHNKNLFGRLFELGPVFSQNVSSEPYKQSQHLGLMAWGQQSTLWRKGENIPLVFEVKAAMEAWLRQFQIHNFSWISPKDKGEVPSFIHLGQFAELEVEGKKVGFIGGLHPLWLEENKVRVPVAVGEFNLEVLYQDQPRSHRFYSISKFPSVERDFAFIMPKSLRVEEVLKSIQQLGQGLLVQSEVFDVYEGEKLEVGKKSVAIRVVFQDKNATLQEEQITGLQKKIVDGLSQQFGVTLR